MNLKKITREGMPQDRMIFYDLAIIHGEEETGSENIYMPENLTSIDDCFIYRKDRLEFWFVMENGSTSFVYL